VLYKLQNGKIVIAETIADTFFCALCTMEEKFGKTVFLTQPEAEMATRKMKDEE